MKIFSLLFFLVFLVFAGLQFNDPDPWLWIPVYLLSAYTALCSFRNYYNPMLIMLLMLGYLIGAIYYFPLSTFSEWIHVEEQARSLEMKMPFVEEARESMGLAVCFLVNLVFLQIGFRKAKMPGYNFGYFYKPDKANRNQTV
jgi:hypothetical protein